MLLLLCFRLHLTEKDLGKVHKGEESSLFLLLVSQPEALLLEKIKIKIGGGARIEIFVLFCSFAVVCLFCKVMKNESGGLKMNGAKPIHFCKEQIFYPPEELYEVKLFVK